MKKYPQRVCAHRVGATLCCLGASAAPFFPVWFSDPTGAGLQQSAGWMAGMLMIHCFEFWIYSRRRPRKVSLVTQKANEQGAPFYSYISGWDKTCIISMNSPHPYMSYTAHQPFNWRLIHFQLFVFFCFLVALMFVMGLWIFLLFVWKRLIFSLRFFRVCHLGKDGDTFVITSKNIYLRV